MDDPADGIGLAPEPPRGHLADHHRRPVASSESANTRPRRRGIPSAPKKPGLTRRQSTVTAVPGAARTLRRPRRAWRCSSRRRTARRSRSRRHGRPARSAATRPAPGRRQRLSVERVLAGRRELEREQALRLEAETTPLEFPQRSASAGSSPDQEHGGERQLAGGKVLRSRRAPPAPRDRLTVSATRRLGPASSPPRRDAEQ